MCAPVCGCVYERERELRSEKVRREKKKKIHTLKSRGFEIIGLWIVTMQKGENSSNAQTFLELRNVERDAKDFHLLFPRS